MTTTTTGVRAWRGTRLGWLGLLPVAGVLLAAVAAAPASAAQLSHPAAPARQAGHHRPAAGVPMTLALAPAGLRAAVRATLARPATAPAASASQTSLLPGDGQADFFGVSIAISGNTALVGGTTAHHHTGAAYVFVHGARGWTQQARLVAADGVALDNFGFSVALDGNTAVVGAPNRGPDGVRSFHGNGGAYVFTRTGTTWTQRAQFTGSTSQEGDQFGWSIAFAGHTAVIGAPSQANTPGAAYVFTQTATGLPQQAILRAPHPQGSDLFGRTVALSGTTALIGAPGVAGFTGAAYVFVHTASGWARQATLTAADGQPGESLALDALAISGDTAVVGEELTNNFVGAAYEFVRTGTTWAQKAKFTAAGGAPNDRLGRGVAIAGTGTALVGAPGHNNFHGQVDLFTL